MKININQCEDSKESPISEEEVSRWSSFLIKLIKIVFL